MEMFIDSTGIASYIPEHEKRNEWLADTQERKAETYMRLSRIYYAISKKIGPSPTVLDVGTGSGFFVNYARELGYKAYGVDSRIAFDRSSIDKDENRFIISKDSILPFLDDSFDLVHEHQFFSDLVEFQGVREEEFDSYLDEIARVTKPGGFYVGNMEYSWLRDSRAFTKMAYSDESMGFYRRNEPDYAGGIGLNISNMIHRFFTAVLK